MDTVEKDVLHFVSKQCGVKESKLNIKTELRKDLGVTGLEAVDFFTAFDNEFYVDFSGFQIDRHFEGEAHGLLFPLGLLQWVYYKVFEKDHVDDLIPITIGDLVESVRKKRWIK